MKPTVTIDNCPGHSEGSPCPITHNPSSQQNNHFPFSAIASLCMILFFILSPKYTTRHGSKSCLAFKTIFYVSSNLQSSPASSLCSSALWSLPPPGFCCYLGHMTLMVICFGILAAIGAALSKISTQIHNSFWFSQIS